MGRLKLVDVLGRVMWQQEITESLYNVPTINLQEGVYFLVSPKNETRKVICKH
ncbi:MAG: hypothetical protein ACI9XB_005339 [Gammaproteobacteria bacterium]